MIVGSSVQQVYDVMSSTLTSGGRLALNTLAPDDFEYYLCAIEVVRSTNINDVLEYFVFPITPNSMTIGEGKSKSITKTMDGVSVIENESFVPHEIQISGDFGRKLKFITRAGSDKSGESSYYNAGGLVKSGYGCVKILEKIFERVSDNKGDPVMVFFYNYAFNSNYLVELMSFQPSQDVNKNMIWNYALSMKAIAPAEELYGDKELKQNLSKFSTLDFVKKSVSSTLSGLSDTLSMNPNNMNQSNQTRSLLNKTSSFI